LYEAKWVSAIRNYFQNKVKQTKACKKAFTPVQEMKQIQPITL